MLSKEEIEKLEKLSRYCALKNIDREDDIFTEFVVIIQKTRNYIKQLENENKMFKDFYTSCGNKDIADNITATKYCKIRESAYWEGYIQKQNEAIEICKQCKYIKKVKQLESDKQELIEKLEKTVKKNNEFEFMPLQIEKAYNNYYKLGKIDLAQEIKEIAKGENNV